MTRKLVSCVVMALALCAVPTYAADLPLFALNGIYKDNSGAELGAEEVPWNDGVSLTLVFRGNEISAFRPEGEKTFVYDKDGCVVTVTPHRIGRKQALLVEAKGTCTGPAALFANLNSTFARSP